MKLTVIFKAIKIVSKLSRIWLIFNILYPIIMGLMPVLTIYITKEFINQLFVLITDEKQSLSIVFLLIAQVLIMLGTRLLNDIKHYLDLKVDVEVGYSIEKKVLTKTTSIKFNNFDDPYFYNYLSRIQGNYGQRFLAPIKEIVELIKNTISLTSIFWYIISIHWIFVLFIIIPLIPLFIAKYKYGINSYKLGIVNTPLKREADYISRLLTNRDAAKEIRIYSLGKYLIERWSNKHLENSNKFLHLSKKQLTIEYYLEIFNCLIYVLTIFYIIKLIKKGTFSIGEYITLIQALQEIQSSLNFAILNITNIIEQSLYLSDYFEFINIKEDKLTTDIDKEKKFPNKLSKGVTIKNLTFSYDSKIILNNINLNINTGEKIAIVGENGSGKSTLIKCLLGLYDAKSGDILFDNISIKDIKKVDLNRNITALFQDFQKYSFTVNENIGFGNLNLLNNNEAITQTAITIGAHEFISKLENGYSTYLNRNLYKGEDISGGQWQKIALARVLIRNSKIIILDEPTSALDPLSEHELYKLFDKVTSEKTVLFISHRMTTTRFADRILVMKNGEIIEEGNFESLMEKNGEFFKMYQIQNNIQFQFA